MNTSNENGCAGRKKSQVSFCVLDRRQIEQDLLDADPGAILRRDQREFCLAWPNQSRVKVKGSHFIQEDSPDEIGRAIAEWLGSDEKEEGI